MANMSRMRLAVVVLIIVAIGLSACTRSASTPPPAADEGLPPGDQSETQATMDAVRSAILTQTAQALGDTSATSTPTPTPLPVDDPSASATLEPDEPEPTADGLTIEYVVLAGDWIFKIARDFDVDPQAIIDLNDLVDPAELEVGMVLIIPSSENVPAATAESTGTPVESSDGGTIHVVKAGEWIWQIARLYGVDPQAIIDANELTSPATIYPGQELIIP